MLTRMLIPATITTSTVSTNSTMRIGPTMLFKQHPHFASRRHHLGDAVLRPC